MKISGLRLRYSFYTDPSGLSNFLDPDSEVKILNKDQILFVFCITLVCFELLTRWCFLRMFSHTLTKIRETITSRSESVLLIWIQIH
jgi:hypothetical protein